MDINKLINEQKIKTEKNNDINVKKNILRSLLYNIKKIENDFNELESVKEKKSALNKSLIDDFLKFFGSEDNSKVFTLRKDESRIEATSLDYFFELQSEDNYKYSLKVGKKQLGSKIYRFCIDISSSNLILRKSQIILLGNDISYINPSYDEIKFLNDQLELVQYDLEQYKNKLNNAESIEFVFKPNGDNGFCTECKNFAEIINNLPHVV